MFDAAVIEFDFVDYRRCSGDQIQIIFPLQPLLDNFHMQQTEETTAEAEAKCG